MPAAHDNTHLRGNLKLSLKWLIWHGATFRKCAFCAGPLLLLKPPQLTPLLQPIPDAAVRPLGLHVSPLLAGCRSSWYEGIRHPSLRRLSSCVAASRPCHDVVGHAAAERTDQGKPPWLPWGVTCPTRLAGSSRAAQGGRTRVRS